MNVCSKVQYLKEPQRDDKVFVAFSEFGFFEKAARRLITIYRDEPSYRNTSELLKALYMCVYMYVCVHARARARNVASSAFAND